MRIWLNDTLTDADDAAVSALDHGLTVGDGVFEAVKTVEGVPFALTLHLERMRRSAAGLGLPAPDTDLVRRACAAVIDAEPHPLGRLRITFTGGRGPLGSMRAAVPGAPTLVVAHEGYEARPDTTAAVTVPWTRNERGALAGLKTTSYAENVLALARAREAGASEAIFPNTAGLLCEGTGSNVFVVVGGDVLTPPLSSGCLAGITRALVVAWSGAREVDLPLGVLRDADEIFLTSTTRDVQALHRVDDRELSAAPGPVTTRLMREFAVRSGADPDPRPVPVGGR
ncbi:aminodeoxychorismate lyase [Streptomyces calidiresistens]|uniref:4-amino-4-deoxychorismate lyase n=1 Tax=Streptomyces calidiresistens TaxID=1485586 RepID=A0A7W3T5R6_9ACTN|nr:aminotransferase class IV [Streptomyces calidiresistens]MBB0231146.1 4-amino-4-deoxychorismate lyase [Streptomyces calidiresistens]